MQKNTKNCLSCCKHSLWCTLYLSSLLWFWLKVMCEIHLYTMQTHSTVITSRLPFWNKKVAQLPWPDWYSPSELNAIVMPIVVVSIIQGNGDELLSFQRNWDHLGYWLFYQVKPIYEFISVINFDPSSKLHRFRSHNTVVLHGNRWRQ